LNEEVVAHWTHGSQFVKADDGSYRCIRGDNMSDAEYIHQLESHVISKHCALVMAVQGKPEDHQKFEQRIAENYTVTTGSEVIHYGAGGAEAKRERTSVGISPFLKGDNPADDYGKSIALAFMSDETIMAECKRRGWEVKR
jgi:hypothetical protein